MTRAMTDYQVLEGFPESRRLLRQEELILEVTEALAEALEREGISKTELARRLDKTKGFVSQVLAGGRNLTLRTIADFCDALQCRVRVYTEREGNLAHITFGRQIAMPLESLHAEPYRIVRHRFQAKARPASGTQVAA